MTRKCLGVLLLTLVCNLILMAQRQPAEVFLGVWEINVQKTVNYQQQTQWIVNVPSPGGFISTRSSIGKNNSSSSFEIHPVAFDGKPYATSGGDAREISYKLIDPHTIERTQNRAGKISVDTEQVSADGKTLTVTQGSTVRIYDKKFDVQPIRP